MFGPIDKPCMIVAKKIVFVWSHLTGKSNFTLARLVLYSGTAVVIAAIVTRYTLSDHDILSSIIYPFCAWFMYWIGRKTLIFIAAMEESQDSMTISMSPRDFLLVRNNSQWWIVTGLFWMPFDLDLFRGSNALNIVVDLCLVVLGMVFYMALNYQGPRQTVWAKVWNKVKESVPTFVPVPQPVPIGV